MKYDFVCKSDPVSHINNRKTTTQDKNARRVRVSITTIIKIRNIKGIHLSLLLQIKLLIFFFLVFLLNSFISMVGDAYHDAEAMNFCFQFLLFTGDIIMCVWKCLLLALWCAHIGLQSNQSRVYRERNFRLVSLFAYAQNFFRFSLR